MFWYFLESGCFGFFVLMFNGIVWMWNFIRCYGGIVYKDYFVVWWVFVEDVLCVCGFIYLLNVVGLDIFVNEVMKVEIFYVFEFELCCWE